MAANSIEIEGVEYIPAKRAARLVGYSADYVGQLARAGKVHAKLVGRSWYVTEDSIREHKLVAHKAKQSQQRMPERLVGSDDPHARDAAKANNNKEKSATRPEVRPAHERKEQPNSEDETHPIALHTSDKRKSDARYAERELARAHVAFKTEAPYHYARSTASVADNPTLQEGAGAGDDASVVRSRSPQRASNTVHRERGVRHEVAEAAPTAVDGVQRAHASSPTAETRRTSSPPPRRRGRMSTTKKTLFVRIRALLVVAAFLLLVGVFAILFW